MTCQFQRKSGGLGFTFRWHWHYLHWSYMLGLPLQMLEKTPKPPGCKPLGWRAWGRSAESALRLRTEDEGSPSTVSRCRHLQQSWRRIWAPSTAALAALRCLAATLQHGGGRASSPRTFCWALYRPRRRQNTCRRVKTLPAVPLSTQRDSNNLIPALLLYSLPLPPHHPWVNDSHVVNTRNHATLIASLVLWPLIHLPGSEVSILNPAANSKGCLYFKINTAIKGFLLSLFKM